MEKRVLIFMVIISMILPIVSAVNIEIKKEVVRDTIISELNEPAVFNLAVKNLGNSDNFEIYSLVGVDFSPRGTFRIGAGETKDIELRVYPDENLRERTGLLNFIYKIRGQDSGIQDDTLTLNIVNFKDAVLVTAGDIAPDSAEGKIYAENKYNFNFSEIKAGFDSVFFTKNEIFSLSPLEKKEIKIPLNKEKMKGLEAGQYILTSKLESGSAKEEFKSTIKYVEKANIAAAEKSSGLIFRERIIERTNEGNILALAEIKIKKDIVSRLFTKFNTEPIGVERKGPVVSYSWSKELKPGETLSVKVDTNYLYPLLMLLGIIIIAFLVYRLTTSTLILRKRVSFVRAKGGEFALKVSIHVSSRKFVEKISIVDRYPAVVKLYERFGIYMPDKIDEKNRRLEWNIESLQPGEDRIFSYIIYSKIGVVGRFELPPALGVFEKDGKLRESMSNKAFFMNEPRRSEED